MRGEGVLVILTNYSRPQNLPACIAAWKGQSVPLAKLVVVDNRPAVARTDEWAECEPYPERSLHGADDVWRMQENLGCPCHFAPALMLHGHRYVLLADDDLLPGARAIEHALETAATLEDRFATLGMVNRRFRLDLSPGERYSGRCTVPAADQPRTCDLTCQAHLVRADVFPHVLAFRQNLLDLPDTPDAPHLVGVHDDFLLCLGVQRATGWPSYVLPASADPERWLIRSRLSEASAIWRRPGHFAEREQMVRLALAAGWRSLATGGAL